MHRDMAVAVGSGSDSVIFEAPMPDQTLVREIRGNVSIKSLAPLNMDEMMYYSCRGYVIALPDPDTVDAVNDIWDRFVPKDVAWTEDAYDIDTSANITATEEEFGMVSLLDLFNDNKGLKEVFSREAHIDIAKMHVQPFLDTTFKYLAMDHFKVNVQKNVGNSVKSYLLFGVGNPDAALVSTSQDPNTLLETNWNRLKYVDRLVENTWEVVAGLVDPEASGALLPGETGMAFLEDMIEQIPRQVANTFNYLAGVIHARMRGYVRLAVPGDFNMKMLGRN